MKNFILALAVLLGLGAYWSSATAQVQNDTVNTQKESVVKEFEPIEMANLPEAIKQAVAKDFEGRMVKEAFTGTIEGIKVYKLILSKEGEEDLTAFLDETGKAVTPENK